ncbi:tRNA (adenosine(37)-N6)-threonylcarbamoyltransferase complex ATPase subunit type 1 TsaE [Candidatus Uhrbacteria bacterium]|nr:tRNA (adenosine(37)-N6)-threonylcarbamoyltransferase complex ATPase subunit type 1 TsaE [Candidatus Uhrbacteria bacterium]
MKIIKTKSEKETMKAAAKFAGRLKGGEVVALHGDLGAGKTAWVKGMAKGFGVKEQITSPTFVLMKCYRVKKSEIRNPKSEINFKSQFSKNFCHIDAYRLKGANELLAIGVEEYLGAPDTITAIEWAERVEDTLKDKKVIKIHFKFGEKEEERVIKIKS